MYEGCLFRALTGYYIVIRRKVATFFGHVLYLLDLLWKKWHGARVPIYSLQLWVLMFLCNVDDLVSSLVSHVKKRILSLNTVCDVPLLSAGCMCRLKNPKPKKKLVEVSNRDVRRSDTNEIPLFGIKK